MNPLSIPMGDIPSLPPGFRAEARGQSAQVIQIDNGKTVLVTALCAAICAACVAVTIGTVWHSKERETETQAQIRVLKNHIDDAYNKLAVLEQSQEHKK